MERTGRCECTNLLNQHLFPYFISIFVDVCCKNILLVRLFLLEIPLLSVLPHKWKMDLFDSRNETDCIPVCRCLLPAYSLCGVRSKLSIATSYHVTISPHELTANSNFDVHNIFLKLLPSLHRILMGSYHHCSIFFGVIFVS